MFFTDYIYDERKEACNEGYREGYDEGYDAGSDGLQECIDLLCKGLTEAQIASKMDLSQEKAMRLIRKAREIIHVLSQRNLSAVQ